MPYNQINRNPNRPCFCGHTFGSHAVPGVVPVPLTSNITLGQIAGGLIGATTYYIRVTYLNPAGETLASPEQSLAVSANFLLTVAVKVVQPNITAVNVYGSTAAGTEQRALSIPVQGALFPQNPFTANYTLPLTGFPGGAALPGSNTATILGCQECGDPHSFSPMPTVVPTPQILNSGR